jgi:hypothetical protein
MRKKFVSIILILSFFIMPSVMAQYVSVPLGISTSYSPQGLTTNQGFMIYVTVTANQQVYDVKCRANPSSGFTIYGNDNYIGMLSSRQSKTCSFSAKAPSYKTNGNLKIDVFYSTSPGTQSSSVATSYLNIPAGSMATNKVTFQLTTGGKVTNGYVTVQDSRGNTIGQGPAISQCTTCAPSVQINLPTGNYNVAANGQIAVSGGYRNGIARPQNYYIDHDPLVIG